ncbi:hypothetical protein RFI_33454, partial [Reticulomyxa filosa]
DDDDSEDDDDFVDEDTIPSTAEVAKTRISGGSGNNGSAPMSTSSTSMSNLPDSEQSKRTNANEFGPTRYIDENAHSLNGDNMKRFHGAAKPSGQMDLSDDEDNDHGHYLDGHESNRPHSNPHWSDNHASNPSAPVQKSKPSKANSS